MSWLPPPLPPLPCLSFFSRGRQQVLVPLGVWLSNHSFTCYCCLIWLLLYLVNFAFMCFTHGHTFATVCVAPAVLNIELWCTCMYLHNRRMNLPLLKPFYDHCTKPHFPFGFVYTRECHPEYRNLP